MFMLARGPRAGLRMGGLALTLVVATVGCGVSGSPGGNGSGQSGSTGSPGTAGSSSAGQAGASGTSGTSGSAGTTGAAGDASGTAGTSAAGTAGTSGAGTAGTSGAGTAGVSGAGTAGAVGTAGSVGSAGATGTAGSTGAGTAGTGVLSGITINIGGAVVPKENAIAFVHFGHSNMAGRGVDPQALRPYFFGMPDMHAVMYKGGAFPPAVEPTTAGDSGNTLNGMVSGGLGTTLVKQAAAMAPGKYFISLGFGAGKAYCSQFLPPSGYYNSVIGGAKALKGKVTFGAIVILLGITERHGTQADIDGYPQCINKLVTAVRTDLGEPNLPMLINDYEMGTTGPLAPTSAFAQAIIPKIHMVTGVVSNSAMIPTDNPIIPIQPDNSTNDWHHFNLAGHQEYAKRVLDTMKTKGWFPW
jgi:hypothetical protein